MTPPQNERAIYAAVRKARAKAFEMPCVDGSEGTRWIQQRAIRDLGELGIRISVTRDAGLVRSGIFSSPDLERCLHLMVSDGRIIPKFPGPRMEPEPETVTTLVRFLFGPMDQSRLWCETSRDKDEHGVQREIHHWRLFCDSDWDPRDVREPGAQELLALGWTRWVPPAGM